MITIYAKTDRDSTSELTRITQKALAALQEAVDHIEASGRSAAIERATLIQLKARLSRLESGVNGGSRRRFH